MLAAQAAGKYGSKLAGHAALDNGDPRDFAEGIGYALDLLFLNVLRSHNTDAGRGLVERNVGTSGGDDDRL